jgi:rhodanese-related sulfurtransferase
MGRSPPLGPMSEERELPPERVAELLESGTAEVVDVRTEEEREAAHIPGTRHVPIDALSAEAGSLDHTKPLVLYCRSGDRSGAAADAFAASGREAYSLEGGLVAWAEEGRPVEPEGGKIASPSGLPPA